MILAPAAFRHHQERGGDSPPPSYSSLASPLDGRRVPPLVCGLHSGRGAGAPLRLDLPLSSLLFRVFCFLAENRFLYSGRSVTPIALRFLHDFFPDISFLAPEVELQPTFEEGTTHHHAPGASGAHWCLVGCVGLRSR